MSSKIRNRKSGKNRRNNWRKNRKREETGEEIVTLEGDRQGKGVEQKKT